MVATCSAAIEATRATEKGGPNDACANSTGAVTSSARLASKLSTFTPASRQFASKETLKLTREL